MAPKLRKVTSVPGTLSFEGKSYGPFEATNKKQFLEVPEDMQQVMNLPLHESDLDVPAEPAPSLDDLVQSHQDLKAELAEARAAALPANALEIIKKVPGVADKLAQPILDALKAAAQPPATEEAPQ